MDGSLAAAAAAAAAGGGGPGRGRGGGGPGMRACRSEAALSVRPPRDAPPAAVVALGKGADLRKVTEAVDRQIRLALEPGLGRLLAKVRERNDLRFVEHGTQHMTRRYDEFEAERAKLEAARSASAFQFRPFYDTRSYSCRDIPSQQDGSLKLLFQYYCRLLTPTGANTRLNTKGGPGLTLEQTQMGNETMSLPELMIFATDFKLVPNIISNAGLHFCWQRQRRGRQNDACPTELDYRSFVEVMVRAALIAFDEIRDPHGRVFELARYLSLDETRKYRKMLASLERSRVGKTRSSKVVGNSNEPSGAERAGAALPGQRQGHKNLIHKNARINFEVVSQKRQRWATLRPASAPRRKAAPGAAAPRDPVPTTEAQNRARKLFWEADAKFDPQLLDILKPYEFENGRVLWLPFEDEAVDMGVLSLGSTHFFKVEVQNMSPNSIMIEAQLSRDLSDSSLTYDPRPMPMGMQREIMIKTCCVSLGETVGSVLVLARNAAGDVVERRNFPVYRNVSQPAQPRQKKKETPTARAAQAPAAESAPQAESVSQAAAAAQTPQAPRSPSARAGPGSPGSPMGVAPRQTPRPRSSVVTGLSLPSPGKRLATQRKLPRSESEFERKPLPVSLMPAAYKLRSLPVKRATMSTMTFSR